MLLHRILGKNSTLTGCQIDKKVSLSKRSRIAPLVPCARMWRLALSDAGPEHASQPPLHVPLHVIDQVKFWQADRKAHPHMQRLRGCVALFLFSLERIVATLYSAATDYKDKQAHPYSSL